LLASLAFVKEILSEFAGQFLKMTVFNFSSRLSLKTSKEVTGKTTTLEI